MMSNKSRNTMTVVLEWHSLEDPVTKFIHNDLIKWRF